MDKTIEKRFILDTNVIYYISDITTNKAIDISKLKKFVREHNCFLTPFTFFEIVNGELTVKQKIQIDKVLDELDIQLYFDQNQFKWMQDLSLDLHFNNEHKINELKSKLSPSFVKYYVFELSLWIDLYLNLPISFLFCNLQFPDEKQKKYWNETIKLNKNKIKKFINYILESKFNKLVTEDKFRAEFIRIEFLVIVANVMTYLYSLYYFIAELGLNKKLDCLGYKISKKYKQLISSMLKDKLSDDVYVSPNCFRWNNESIPLNLCAKFELMQEQYCADNNLKFSRKTYRKKLLQYFISTLRFHDDEEKLKIFEKPYFENIIKERFVDANIMKDDNLKLVNIINEAKFEPNDILDYKIMQYAYHFKILLISFDKNIKKHLATICQTKQSLESLAIINSFYI